VSLLPNVQGSFCRPDRDVSSELPFVQYQSTRVQRDQAGPRPVGSTKMYSLWGALAKFHGRLYALPTTPLGPKDQHVSLLPYLKGSFCRPGKNVSNELPIVQYRSTKI
jgi:hypothetical protein